MQVSVICVVIASLYWVNLVHSAAINSDFITPEELEAIRSGSNIQNKVTDSKPPFQQPQPIIKKPPLVSSPSLPVRNTFDDRPVWGSSSVSSANAQAQSVNKFAGQDQSAGANSYDNTVTDEHGTKHNSGASGISGVVSEDGSKGSLSAANTQKMTSHTADGSKHQESAQSQSTNFDKHSGSLQASDANTNLIHTIDKTGEKREMSSGSSATNQNQFGTGGSKAQTKVEEYNVNGIKGQKTSSVSQASQINKDGSLANAHSHSDTNTYKAPDGSEVTETKVGATSSTNGQGGNSGSSTNCAGSSGGGGGQNGGYSQSYSSSSSSSFTNANGQTSSQTGCETGSKAGGLPGVMPNFPQVFNPGFQPGFQQFPFPFPYVQPIG